MSGIYEFCRCHWLNRRRTRRGYMALSDIKVSSVGDEWVILEPTDFPIGADLQTEEELFVPELKNLSDILSEDICTELVQFLPDRVQANPWHLVYSTASDGYSLRTLCKKLQENSPILLVVQDFQNHVFGTITSAGPRVCQTFSGTGESCVFSCSPQLKAWKWSSGNNYNIISGSTDWMAVGCDGGAFALWLDADLYRGRTSACGTFQNDPLCECGDFLIKTVEVWTFSL